MEIGPRKSVFPSRALIEGFLLCQYCAAKIQNFWRSPDSDLVFVPEFLQPLFPLLPKLIHFSTQAIEIRKNHGLSDSAFPEFDFKAWNASRFNRDRFYGGIWLLKFIREPRLAGTEHHESTALGCNAACNMGKVQEQRNLGNVHLSETFFVPGKVGAFPLFPLIFLSFIIWVLFCVVPPGLDR